MYSQPYFSYLNWSLRKISEHKCVTASQEPRFSGESCRIGVLGACFLLQIDSKHNLLIHLSAVHLKQRKATITCRCAWVQLPISLIHYAFYWWRHKATERARSSMRQAEALAGAALLAPTELKLRGASYQQSCWPLWRNKSGVEGSRGQGGCKQSHWTGG